MTREDLDWLRAQYWGDFTPPMKQPKPRTKPSTFRSQYENARPEDAITPPNFARAFFEANP